MSDGKEVKRYSGRALPRLRYESAPVDDVIQEQFFIKEEDHLAAIAELRAEVEALGKVYRSTCPECGYAGCVRGKKACDAELDRQKETIAELRAEVDRLKSELGKPYDKVDRLFESNKKHLETIAELRVEVERLKEAMHNAASSLSMEKKQHLDTIASYSSELRKADETIARQARVIEKLKTQRSILVSFAHCGDILTDETLERMNHELAAIERAEGEKE